jgi:hypothetical protein
MIMLLTLCDLQDFLPKNYLDIHTKDTTQVCIDIVGWKFVVQTDTLNAVNKYIAQK